MTVRFFAVHQLDPSTQCRVNLEPVSIAANRFAKHSHRPASTEHVAGSPRPTARAMGYRRDVQLAGRMKGWRLNEA